MGISWVYHGYTMDAMAHSSWPQSSPCPSWHPETPGAAKRIACSAPLSPPAARAAAQKMSRQVECSVGYELLI